MAIYSTSSSEKFNSFLSLLREKMDKLVESIKNQEYNLTIQLNNIGEFSSIIQLNSSSKESDNVLTKRLRDTKSIIDNNEYFEDKIFNYAADGIKAEPNGNNRQILDVINSKF